MRAPRRVRITLVVLSSGDVERVVREGTRALASRVAGGDRLLQDAGGHPLVIELRERVRDQADELLKAQQLLWFAEIALRTELAVLLEHRGATIDATLTGVDIRRGGVALTFGFFRNKIHAAVGARGRQHLPDVLRARSELLARHESNEAVGRLSDDRNDVAHHRKPRELDKIIEDVEYLFGPDSLPSRWQPFVGTRWIRTFDGEFALLDAVDYVRRQHLWLIPRHREHRQTDVDSSSAECGEGHRP